MRRIAFFLLTTSLVALGCGAGALCAAADAAEADCCCPMTMDGQSPCMEESDPAPMPGDQDATADGPSQTAWDLARATPVPLPAADGSDPRRGITRDPVTGEGPAVYLLVCSFRN